MVCVIVLLAPWCSVATVVQDKPVETQVTAEELKQKKQLLRLMDELEAKLPRELGRKLIILSMHIATGYCSPYSVKEFEDALAGVAPSVSKAFDAEWRHVREHPLWPSTTAIRKQAPAKPIS